MKNRNSIFITLTGVLVGALSYWPIPYGEVNVLNTYNWLIVGVLSFIGAFICRLIFKKIPMRIGLLISLGVVLSVIFRILYDTFFLDSTSHNLAPLEIIFAAFQSLPLAFLGAYLAKGIKSFKK